MSGRSSSQVTKATVLAKGSNFHGLIGAFGALKGQAAVDRALALAPSEVSRAIAYGQVVRVGWYPVEWFGQLHEAVARAVSGGPQFARALGRAAAAADFGSLHRIVVSMLNVETVFGQCHRLMGLYWKGGTIQPIRVASGHGQLRFTGWKGFTPLVWEDVLGGVEASLEVCRARNVRCRPEGPLHEVDSLIVDLRWT